ncbi:NHL repeat-containing protein [Solimonas marina]|uniref:NHL repeat containing protein n=1 Tax=Solimonas marina TaxID=2714601 RepID=A0A970B7I2_9GAMM|nr:NHL repeat-containing protein [Solimonas marina]NKF23933.1 hypothetical protein [Solimonas marina]
MRLRRAFAASLLSPRRLVRKSSLVVTASTLLLAACGGGGGDNIDWETAFQVIGHTNFQQDDVNDTQSTPQSYTLATPFGNVASDGTKLYVADTANNRILVWTSIPTTNGQVADLVIGQDDFTTKTSGTTASKLATPYQVSIGSGGQLVVADTGNNRVLIWDTAPTTQSEIDAGPDVVVGQGGSFTTQVSGTTAQNFNAPTAAVISNNKLIVADQGNNRVLIWSSVPTAGTEDASIVLGQSDFTSNGDDDGAADMYKPTSIWTDGTQLLVADTGNYRVLYWSTFPQSSATEASYVVGQTDFNRSTYSTSASTFESPTGVASDGAQFWVADRGSNRVVKFDSMPASNGMSASLVYGQDNQNFTASAANDDDQDGKTDNDDDDQENGAATKHTLNGPTGVYVEGGVLYITDRGNSRVEMYAP